MLRREDVVQRHVPGEVWFRRPAGLPRAGGCDGWGRRGSRSPDPDGRKGTTHPGEYRCPSAILWRRLQNSSPRFCALPPNDKVSGGWERKLIFLKRNVDWIIGA